MSSDTVTAITRSFCRRRRYTAPPLRGRPGSAGCFPRSLLRCASGPPRPFRSGSGSLRRSARLPETDRSRQKECRRRRSLSRRSRSLSLLSVSCFPSYAPFFFAGEGQALPPRRSVTPKPCARCARSTADSAPSQRMLRPLRRPSRAGSADRRCLRCRAA